MTHHQFQHDTIDGGTDVQFNLDYDGNSVSILNIQLHSNFKSGLPHSAYIEYDNETGKYRLCSYYNKENDGNIIRVREWLISPLAMNILARILQMKEEETPKFDN